MNRAYSAIARLALKKYQKFIQRTAFIQARRSCGSGKLRLTFKDGSFMDIFFSGSGKYSFHWERRMIDGKIYRFDNAPHHPHIGLQHLHQGSEDNIVAYSLNRDPIRAFREVMAFVENILKP